MIEIANFHLRLISSTLCASDIQLPIMNLRWNRLLQYLALSENALIPIQNLLDALRSPLLLRLDPLIRHARSLRIIRLLDRGVSGLHDTRLRPLTHHSNPAAKF